MKRKIVLMTALAASVAIASPAMAWGGSSGGKPKPKPPVSSTSGGNTSTSSGGHKVPEPGMLGLMGAGLIGLGLARRRRKA